MKLLKLILSATILLLSKQAYSDLAPPPFTHVVHKCIRFTNIQDFADITLLEYIIPKLNYPTELYTIYSYNCLTQGGDNYFPNDIEIYAVNTSYISDKDITEIDPRTDPHSLRSNITPNVYGDRIPDGNALIVIREYYRIVGFTNTNVVIYKWKEERKYIYGYPATVDYFEYEGDSASLSHTIVISDRKEMKIPAGILLFPNPAKDYMNVFLQNDYFGRYTIDIISAEGKLAQKFTLNKKAYTVNERLLFNILLPGNYFVVFRHGQAIETKKIIIE